MHIIFSHTQYNVNSSHARACVRGHSRRIIDLLSSCATAKPLLLLLRAIATKRRCSDDDDSARLCGMLRSLLCALCVLAEASRKTCGAHAAVHKSSECARSDRTRALSGAHRTKKCVILKVCACCAMPANNKRCSRYISTDVWMAWPWTLRIKLRMHTLLTTLVTYPPRIDIDERMPCAELSARSTFARLDIFGNVVQLNISAWHFYLSLCLFLLCKIFDNICKWFIVFSAAATTAPATTVTSSSSLLSFRLRFSAVHAMERENMFDRCLVFLCLVILKLNRVVSL